MMFPEVNQYQTPITEELLAKYPDEVQEQLLDFIQNVEFIRWLISPDRPYAKDCPHDGKGRIIVDLEHPHIVENMDYFRQPALHFLKYGCYTRLKPNSNPHSEYRRFWDEEIRRIREGYMRESDGEWVTGYCYWFLNYNPMMINKLVEGSKRAVRVEEFPYFFEGIYWRFHYIWQARQAGKHAIELARRGAHPYFQKVFTPNGWTTWENIRIGDYLYGTDGKPTKVIDIPYDREAPYYKITFRDGREVYASDDHKWVVKIHNHKNLETLTTTELINIYKGTRKVSYRLPGGIEYIAQVLKNKGVEFPYSETKVDPYTFGFILGDGCFRHAACYVTQKAKDMEELRKYIPYTITKWASKYAYDIVLPSWKPLLREYGLLDAKSEDKFIPNEYKYNSREVRLNILKGLMDTDGCAQKKRAPYFNTVSKRLAEDVMEVARSLGYNCSCCIKKSGYRVNGMLKECLPCYNVTIYAGSEIFNLSRKKDNVEYKCSRARGTIITNIEYLGETKCKCVTVDAEDQCYLIGDFVTTHNCAKSYSLSSIMTHNLLLGESAESNRRVMTVLAAYQKEYLKDDKDGTLSKFRPAINFIAANTPFPNLMLKNSPNEMSWQMGYKDEEGRDKGSFNTVMGVAIKDDEGKLRGKRGIFLFEEMGSMPNLLTVYDTTRKSVEDGDFTFGQIYLVGTAAEKESDFASAKTLLYAPEGYNIYAIRNVFDLPKQGKPTFGFFFPAYINRAGCYNKDGVSDVIKALLEILLARYKAKYSADPKSVLRVIAEDPITPAEAIIKVKAAYFPISQLNERAMQLDSDPRAYNDVYVGELVQNQDGKIVFRPTDDEPIRKWGVANDTPGAIEIYEMPEKNSNGEVYSGRYIIGHDPVDNDSAESSSLSSTFVFDLFTDHIVAEFTGRKAFADDNFEIVRKLALFYNAKVLYEANKKGLFAYFQRCSCTHLLAETPEYLREKQLVKYSNFGSNKYGVNASAAINSYADSLLRDWLLKPQVIIVKDENGEEHETTLPMLYFLRNRALIDECVNYSPEVNVDRIRAMGMVMLLREEKIAMFQGDMSHAKDDDIGDPLADDPFFTRNYDDRFIRVNLAK